MNLTKLAGWIKKWKCSASKNQCSIEFGIFCQELSWFNSDRKKLKVSDYICGYASHLKGTLISLKMKVLKHYSLPPNTEPFVNIVPFVPLRQESSICDTLATLGRPSNFQWHTEAVNFTCKKIVFAYDWHKSQNYKRATSWISSQKLIICCVTCHFLILSTL